MSDPVLDVRHVSQHYAGRLAVSNASFRLHAGRIACLLGPSGCGKSTLLRLIAGLEPLDEGEIAIGGRTVSTGGIVVPPEERGVGLVFQDCALFPHLTVADNVGFGLNRLTREAKRDRVASLLERFHIEPLTHAWPHTLSGGEQQRVAIARAMAREPALLLLDEPFSGLDEQLRANVRRSVLADLRAAGASVLIVTHDPEEALLIADDLVLMSGGRILQTGGPSDCYRHPVSPEAARLLGDAAVLPAAVVNGVARTAFGDVPAPSLSDGCAQVIVRPEGLRLDGSGFPATVTAVGFAGASYIVELESGEARVSVRVTTSPPVVGTRLHVSLDPAGSIALGPEARETP